MADEQDEHGYQDEGEHGEGPEASGPASEEQEAFDAMLDAIRQAKVAQLIVSSVSTFASVAYGKLEAKELDEAKLAIDAIDALVPFLDEAMRRDFVQAVTNLKVAYSNAVSAAE